MRTLETTLRTADQAAISRRNLLALGLAAVASPAVLAQDFPNRTIQIVVPYPPAGLTDNIGRLFANRMKDVLKQAVVVDNKPGAGASLGAGIAARAPADGHTLLLGSVGMVTNPFMFKSLPYKPEDFEPLMLTSLAPNVLYVHPSLPVKSVRELVDYAKKNPGMVSFASTGQGSSPHLAASLFSSKAGISLLHVPYKGTSQAITDVLGGQVKVYFDTMQSMQYVKEGKLRALAVTTEKRLPSHPDLPTVDESGVANGVVSSSWFGFFIHAKTPAAVQRQLADALLAIGREKDVQEKLVTMGVIPAMLDAPAFDQFFKRETAKWGDVIRTLNIRAD
jgi:tripartite-type tricarboxylate transporter receptor subunit TctC